MKQKLLTLMTLLLCAVSGAWAQDDPTLDVEFTSSTKDSWLKNWETEGITLSGSGGFGSSSGYYYSGCSGNASAVESYYFGIKANSSSKKIVKVSIFVSPNNSNKAYPVFVGWDDTPALKNVACYKAIEGTSTSNTKANGEWITYDLEAEGITKNISEVHIYRKVSAGNFFESETAPKSIGDGKDLGAGVTLRIWKVRVWLASAKTITSQEFAGVKVNGAEIASSKYTKEGNTITLTDSYVSAPTVALINHITYDDSSTDDEDVDVTLGAAAGGFFSGSATIGATDYTVKVPVDVTPTLEADKSSLTVTSLHAAKGTATITLTGANLTGDASVAFASAVDGLTISPATITVTAGAVNQEFTVTYQSNDDVAEAIVNLTFTVGSKSVVIPVTYSSTAAITTITDVSTAKVWDFAQAGTANIESPLNGSMIPFANVSGFEDGFDYASLAGNAQYFYYHSNKCFQGNALKFHTTAAGHITVEFSNTGGGDRPYRHLYVNDVDTNKKSNSTSKVTAENISVEAGDVVLTGMMENGDDPLTPNMLRIYKVTFVPNDYAYVSINEYGWTTFVTDKVINVKDVSEPFAFYMVTNHDGNKITKTQLKGTIPANTPLLVAGTETILGVPVVATSSTDVSANKLKAGTGAAVAAESDKTKYVLSVSGGKAAFKKINATSATVPVGKAYLQFDEEIEAPLFSLDDETTAIKAVESNVVENQKFYNLAGQRVAQPTKGLYIVNGKKVIK